MKQPIVTVLALLLAGVWSLASIAQAEQPARQVSIGAPAPAFELKDLDGKAHSLGDYTGKILVLEWINPDCPFVQRHYKSDTMTALQRKYADKGVQWVAVATGQTADAAGLGAFVKKEEIVYPIVLDPSGDVARTYGAMTTPHMYVIDAQGILRYMGGIDNDPRGNKSDRINYVDQALNELTGGNPVSTSESKPYGCSIKFK